MNTIYHMFVAKCINLKGVFGESIEYNANMFINLENNCNTITIVCDERIVHMLTKKLNEKYGLMIPEDECVYFDKYVYRNLYFYHLDLTINDKNKLAEKLKNVQSTYVINGEIYNKKVINISNKRSYYEARSYIDHSFDKNYKLIAEHEIIYNMDNIFFLKGNYLV